VDAKLDGAGIRPRLINTSGKIMAPAKGEGNIGAPVRNVGGATALASDARCKATGNAHAYSVDGSVTGLHRVSDAC
jgi:hypothetical protein